MSPAAYDFRSLSSHDFELLVRDLLGAEWNIKLDSFKAGRDGGIDLRYSRDPQGTLIVQCKHYIGTGYDGLLSHIKSKELPKVQRLNPGRYVLATSVALTPGNKTELATALSPYVHDDHDVFGQENLNQLLDAHSKVHTSHFKLWLASTEILERTIHSGIHNFSDAAIARMRNHVKVYVQSENFDVAKKALDEQNYCLISGPPGVGKTTIAEILVLHYLNNEYQGVIVTADIEEAFRLYKPGTKQVFYYDDFLGQTSFDEKLGKNEENRIIELIHLAKKSGGETKFIFTTREYILQQAQRRYPNLSSGEIEYGKAILEIGRLSQSDRAMILYNHLYFSELDRELIDGIISTKTYKDIISHDGFSPRIISWMTQRENVTDKTGASYCEQFIKVLDNPDVLWENVFDEQLSEDARHLVMICASFPSEVLLEDLRFAFNQFLTVKRQRVAGVGLRDTFNSALKEITDTFVVPISYAGSTIMRFKDASIRDYAEARLAGSWSEFEVLRDSAAFFSQLAYITTNDKFIGPTTTDPDSIVASFDKAMESRETRINFKTGFYDHGFERAPWSYEVRAALIIGFASKYPASGTARTLANKVIDKVTNRIIQRQTDKSDLYLFIEAISWPSVADPALEKALISAIKDFLFDEIYSTSALSKVVKLTMDHPTWFTNADDKKLEDVFHEIYDSEIASALGTFDFSEMDHFLHDFLWLAENFSVTVEEEEELFARLNELEDMIRDDDDYDRDDDRRSFQSYRAEEGLDIDTLFGSL